MDAALYLSLRDEIQQDAARVERQLEELRRAESFLLRRIHSTSHLASYRAVLNDLSSDITRAESDHTELLHLSRFVTRALVTFYGKEPGPAPLAKSSLDSTEPPKPEREQTKASAGAPLPTNEPAKSNGPALHSNGSSTRGEKPIPKPKTEVPLPPLKSTVVEFDKEGFPIVVAPAKSSPAATMPSPIALRDTAPIAEPPTVVFDENGFPLNPPDDESLKTLMEIPKPRVTGDALTKKDT